MKPKQLFAAVVFTVLSAAVSAATINVVATDTADSTSLAVYDFGGSLLSVDFTFDISGSSGPPSLDAEISNVSGTATWTDGTAFSFSPTFARVSSFGKGYTYFYELAFFLGPDGYLGPGVALPGGDSLIALQLTFAVPEDPWGPTMDLSDLILSGSVFWITAFTNSVGISGHVSESVTLSSITELAPVPLPASATMLLLAVGVVGLLRRSRMRSD